MKTTDKASFIGLIVFVVCLYLLVQLNFLNYYEHMGIPLGRVDVDNYLGDVRNPDYGIIYHTLLIQPAKVLSSHITPELYFTYLIPLILCIALPISIFMLSFFLSESALVALFATVVCMLGTITLTVFGISGAWAQMMATVFFLWFIIYYESYNMLDDDTRESMLFLTVVAICLTALSHIKVLALIFLYFMVRELYIKRYKFVVPIGILSLIMLILFGSSTLGDYQYNMTLWEVLTRFVSPISLILIVFSIIWLLCKKNPTEKERSMKILILFSVMTFIISSFAILWRPLFSVIPIFVVIGVIYLFKIFERITLMYKIILSILIILSAAYFCYMSVEGGLLEMYKETIPGCFNDTTRNIDSRIIKSLYFSNLNDTIDLGCINFTAKPVHRVVGHMDYLNNKIIETDIVYNIS
jgi:hypothetical protein